MASARGSSRIRDSCGIRGSCGIGEADLVGPEADLVGPEADPGGSGGRWPWLTNVGEAWVVLLPLKPLPTAKTRLARPDRPALALAMAMDTVSAALAAGPDVVAAAVVVTNDPWASSVFTQQMPGRERVAVVPDLPATGLNEALRHAARVAVSRWPGLGVAALSADLAALRPAELRRALLAAPPGGRGVVADAHGTGTVLLTASAGVALRPAFGPGSLRAHIASGALDLTAGLGPGVAGLRRDVDTVADLDAARRLGVGPATGEILAGADVGTGNEK